MKYKHPKHGTIFVAQGLGNAYGTFYRKPNGSLKRVVSPDMPMTCSSMSAAYNLNKYAVKNRLETVNE